MSKILTISNIHGRLNELSNLLQLVSEEHKLNSFDQIIFLGDYIAFGKESIGVLDMLMKIKAKYPQTVILRGNWEYALLHTLDRKSKVSKDMFDFFLSYGQGNLLKEIRADKSKMNEYIDFIKSMPKYFIKDNFMFTHAGIDLGYWDKDYDVIEFMEGYDESHLLWFLDFYEQTTLNWFSRTYYDEHTFDLFPYKIVAGQVSLDKVKGQPKGTKNIEPYAIDNIYGIDFGGALSKGQLGAVVFKDDGISTYVVDVGSKPKEKETKPEEPEQVHTNNEDPSVYYGEEPQFEQSNEEPESPYTNEESEPVFVFEEPEPIFDEEPELVYASEELGFDYSEVEPDFDYSEVVPDIDFSNEEPDYVYAGEYHSASKNETEDPEHILTFEMLNDGMSIDDIMMLRNYDRETIENHIVKCIEEDRIKNYDDFITAQHFNIILNTVKTSTFGSLTEVKKSLPEDISIFEIRIVLFLINKLNL